MKRSEAITQIKLVLGRELPGKYVTQALAEKVLASVEELGRFVYKEQDEIDYSLDSKVWKKYYARQRMREYLENTLLTGLKEGSNEYLDAEIKINGEMRKWESENGSST